MADGLFDIYTTQFSTYLELKLQQMGSLLRGKVREGQHVGKMASPINQIGAISAKAPAGRFAPKNRTDPEFTRRWVFPKDKEIDQYIDTFDELKTIVDPKSQYSENAANAIGRAWDDEIIAQAFATAQIGQDAGSLTTEQFDPNSLYTIADTFGSGATATGLTVAKMIEVKRIFRHNHVMLDSDPITLVIGSTQESDLLNQVQVVSTEFNDRPVYSGDGNILRFLGFNIVLSERLATTSGDRNVIAFAKSGMYLGLWKDMINRVSIRNDLSSEPYDVYTQTSFGATRTQPGKVLKVLCVDATGGDITP